MALTKNTGASYDAKRRVFVSDLGEVVATDVRIVQTYLSRHGSGRMRTMMLAKCNMDSIERTATIYCESKKAVIHGG